MSDVLGVRLPEETGNRFRAETRRLGMSKSMLGRVCIQAALSDLDQADDPSVALGQLLEKAASGPVRGS